MIKRLDEFIEQHRKEVYLLLRRLHQLGRTLLLKSEIEHECNQFCSSDSGKNLKNTPFEKLMLRTEVAALQFPWLYFSVRVDIGKWEFYRFHLENVSFNEVTVAEYLKFQESIVNHQTTEDDWTLEVDLGAFNRRFPTMKEKKSIGNGVQFLNRHLSTLLFSKKGEGDKKIFNFLRVHSYNSHQLMLNHRIKSVEELQEQLREAVAILNDQDASTVWTQIEETMQDLGFEQGWGRTVARIKETMELLIDIFEAPDPAILEKFLSRLPMLFRIVILSPHGYFGQSNVLGLPDTGGQVVYILDQVRALEREMNISLTNQGLDLEPEILIITRLIPNAGNTTCNQRVENVIGTHNAKILRVPFRNESGEIMNDWISRFDIWPYLERFANDAEKEILAELGQRPDFIIGNYSDGNLVATLLAHKMGVTQCNIAHALEKTKYLFSALYWKDNEEQYHFSSQFTADLIAMNAADFIITSTYQEIAGTRQSVGQYESYNAFTMPALYRVVKGVNIFDPKFNIVSPGSDPKVYFPFWEDALRLTELHDELEQIVFGEPGSDGRGQLKDPDKPIIFAMSRLDHVKNITGLVEWYGKSDRLRELANLFLVAGHVDINHSNDDEEKQQIDKMYHLLDEYDLYDQVRWYKNQSDKNLVGELYRYIADRRGVFMQPALFEAFGLTVIEAMVSGLPVFATHYGGPLEIIQHGKSGFHIDPNYGESVTQQLIDFFERCQEDNQYWRAIAEGGVKRVEERYTWKLYASRLLSLARIYGFWKYVSNLEREEIARYLEMFYGLMYRKLSSF
ncbi:MAG: sucrose synthase [Caldithrix sp.]|nr:sucrose synthase [Caldithrix sp.]